MTKNAQKKNKNGGTMENQHKERERNFDTLNTFQRFRVLDFIKCLSKKEREREREKREKI